MDTQLKTQDLIFFTDFIGIPKLLTVLGQGRVDYEEIELQLLGNLKLEDKTVLD